eukprot:5863982-Amphidinium_carterae.1
MCASCRKTGKTLQWRPDWSYCLRNCNSVRQYVGGATLRGEPPGVGGRAVEAFPKCLCVSTRLERAVDHGDFFLVCGGDPKNEAEPFLPKF